jgi:hypothetical protein
LSRYSIRPLDLSGLKTISLNDRPGKVKIEDFAKVYRRGESFLDTLPAILAGNCFRGVVQAIRGAKAAGKPVIWGMGGHVIKCGLAPVLTDLMKRGYATAFSMNGAASIHDFEIAIAGSTSEDVETALPDGRFGSAEETGLEMNEAIRMADDAGIGMGESISRLAAQGLHAEFSLLAAAYHAKIPVTVHVAIGTDTPHTHPAADPGSIGRATHRDFRLLCSLVKQLDHGGVYINAGSAVIMPEVFLKALSAVRNLGFPVTNFTTVNFDFHHHYRPQANVVSRPHAHSGGRGYAITGHHELTIPLLAMCLIESRTPESGAPESGK